MISDKDIVYLQRCIELARAALETGDQPFGSVLVSADGQILFEDHNHVANGDHTRHPEFELSRWAANQMSTEERCKATVYTSGEHCPMCAAAHGWVGLGRIVFASSSQQLTHWLSEMGIDAPPVHTLPIHQVIRDVVADGPVPELAEEIHELHRQYYSRSN